MGTEPARFDDAALGRLARLLVRPGAAEGALGGLATAVEGSGAVLFRVDQPGFALGVVGAWEAPAATQWTSVGIFEWSRWLVEDQVVAAPSRLDSPELDEQEADFLELFGAEGALLVPVSGSGRLVGILLLLDPRALEREELDRLRALAALMHGVLAGESRPLAPLPGVRKVFHDLRNRLHSALMAAEVLEEALEGLGPTAPPQGHQTAREVCLAIEAASEDLEALHRSVVTRGS